MELRQTHLRPRLRRRIRHRLVGLVLVWLLPAWLVVALAYLVVKRS